MTNKLKQLFGIDYEIRDITQENKLKSGTQSLIKQIQQLEIEEGNRFELYFFLLELKIADSHFKVSPGTERFSKIVISVNTTRNSANKNFISFLNPYMEPSPPPEVAITAYCSLIKYSMLSEYWEKHTDYSDFLAIVVSEKCGLRDKKITFSLTAHATEKYRRRLIDNSSGTVTSKNVFPLNYGIKVWEIK